MMLPTDDDDDANDNDTEWRNTRKKITACDLMLTGVCPTDDMTTSFSRATSHEKIVNIELRKFVYRIHGAWP